MVTVWSEPHEKEEEEKLTGKEALKRQEQIEDFYF